MTTRPSGALLTKTLHDMGGFSVEEAETAEEALQKMEGMEFDLVLTDLKLPSMDGLQLITQIVNSKPEILTILVTGHASIDSAVEAIKTRGKRLSDQTLRDGGNAGPCEKGLGGEKTFC